MLSDDKVCLRKLEVEDLDRTWVWLQKPDVYWKIGVDMPVSKASQLRWFEEQDKSSSKIVFAICLSGDGRHMGNVSLDMIDWRHRNARLAVFIGDEEQRGNRIGTRGVRLAARYAFDFLNLHKVWCKTTAGDEAVLRFYKKIGFRVEGTLVQHEFIEGNYVDKVVLGLLKGNFKEASIKGTG